MQRKFPTPTSTPADPVEVLGKLTRALKASSSYRLLEQRMVFDGAAAETVAQATEAINLVEADPAADVPTAPVAEPVADDVAELLAALAEAPVVPPTGASTIVFIDSRVGDPATIAAAVPDGAEVVFLDANRDGLEQIAEVLNGRSGIDAIHIVSHGSEGELLLGNAIVNAASMQGEHLDELRAIGDALSAEGDILIYGCDFAAGDKGLEAAMILGGVTGADIAASEDPTGNADLGGDWDLEHQVGEVDAITIEAAEWNGLLVQTTINSTGGLSATGADGLRIYVTNDGQLQVRYQGQDQFYLPGATDSSTSLFNGMYMAVGTQMVGPDTSAEGMVKVPWRSAGAQTISGTGTLADPFIVTTMMYYDQNANNAYNAATDTLATVKTIYVFPNKYFTQQVTITPPATNTNVIKFYHAIDTYLAGGDNGPAFSLNPDLALTNNTTGDPSFVGVRKGVGTANESLVGFAEVQGDAQFARYYSASYNGMYSSMASGGDLTNTWNTNPSTDNGIAVQFTLGAVTGPTTFSYHIAFDGDTKLDLDANDSTATGANYVGTFTVATGEQVSVVDSDVKITNVIGDIADATIKITNPQAGDVLSIDTSALPPGITVEARSADSITISGIASEADYEAAIKLIKFSTTAGSTTARTITVSVHNQLNSVLTTSTTTLNGVFTPTVDLNSGLVGVSSTNNIIVNGSFSDYADAPFGWTESGTTAGIATDSAITGRYGFTATAADTLTKTGLTGLNVGPSPAGAGQITLDLGWVNTGTDRVMNITVAGVTYASFNTATGVITYSGGATNASGGTSTTIAAMSSGTGTLSSITINLPASVGSSGNLAFVTTSGADDIYIDNIKLYTTITTFTDAASGANWSATFTQNGTAVAIADTDADVRDGDNANMASAIITISNAQTGDRLLVSGSAAASGTILGISYTNTGSTITLTGSATKATYAAAIRAISFEHTTGSAETGVVRDITVVVNDGANNSNVAHSYITVVDPSPTLDLDANNSTAAGSGYAAIYTENGTPVAVADVDAAIADTNDANMESASVTLANPQTGDRLLVGGSPAASGTIGTISWTRTDATVTFTGTATRAQYATALQQVQFENTTDTPATVARTINTTVSDGTSNSNTAVTTINIDRAPDPANDSFSGNEGGTVSGNVATNDTDLGDGGGGFAVVTGPASGTLTSFSATTGAFVYTPTSADFAGSDTFTYRYTDADGDTKTATVTITVNPVNDAPVNTLPSGWTTVEDVALKLSGLSVTDIDAASGAISVTLAVGAGTGTISATSGAGVTVTGSGTSSLTLSGTLSDINAYVASSTTQPVYTPALDLIGTVTLTMTTDDQGNAGSGGAQKDVDTRTITILRDTDGDKIADTTDIDDDNDGILDTIEDGVTTTNALLNFASTGVTWPTGAETATFTNVSGSGTSVTLTLSDPLNRVTTATENSTNTGNGDTAAFFITGSTGIGAGNMVPLTIDLTANPAGAVSFMLYHINNNGAGGDQFTISAETVSGTILTNPTLTTPNGATPVYTITGNTVNANFNQFQTGDRANLLVGFTPPAGETITRVIIEWRDSAGGTAAQHGFGIGQINYAVSSPKASSDSDSFINSLDIDSDNDGITDNVEAQTTAGYIAPTGLDTDGDGLDNAYDATSGSGAAGSNGLTAVNTDGADNADYLDLDTDNDGLADVAERGTGPTSITSTTDTDKDGLLDIFEASNVNDGFDVNDENRIGITWNLADSDGDAATAIPLTADRDWRDDVSPTSLDASVTTPEDTTKVFAASDFPFSDAGGQSLNRVRIDTLPALGSLRLNGVAVLAGQIITVGDIASGKLTWVPPADTNGTGLTSFTFSVGDARTFDAAPNTMTINVTPVADITNDAVTTNEDTVITFNVIAGTNGATADSFEATPSLTSFTTPSNGTVSVAANGTITYTPSANFSGVDSFDYTVTSGGVTETATVQVTVNAVNSPPVIDLNSTVSTADTDRGFTTIFATGSPTAIAIADTDADIFDNAENDITKLTIVAGGTSLASSDRVTIAGQTVTLDANATFSNVTVGGSSVNISYIASTRTFSVTNAAGATTPINVTDLETLVRGITYQSTSITQPPSNRDFSFTVTDSGLNTSAAAVASVAFLPPPDATNDSFTTAHDTPVAIAVLVNDTDPQSDPLAVTHINGTAVIAGGPGVNVTGGVVTLDGLGNLVFTPAPNYAGPTSFTYTIGDGTGGQDTATVTGTVTTIAPIVDLNSGISSGEQITNGANPGGTGWTESVNAVASGPATSGTAAGMYVFNSTDSGAVTLTQTGISGWDAGAAPSGAAQLTFDFLFFRNGSGATGGGTMTVSIGGVVYATITNTNVNNPATITYSNGASGAVDGSAATVNIAADDKVAITLNLPSTVASSGDLVFSYISANPNKVDFAIDTISVIATADATAGNDFSTTFAENGTPVSIADTDNTVRDNDDTNMESATITLTNPQTGDRLLVNGSAGTTGTIGAITWTRTDTTVTFSGTASEADYAAAIRLVQFENTGEMPGAGQSTARIIHTVVNDGSTNSNTAVTTITVDLAPDPANDAFSGNEDTAITGDVDANDTDTGSGPGANPLAIVAGPANGTLTSFNTATGAFSYTPNGDFNGTDTFTYSYKDIDGDTKTATVTITVNAVNDAPVNTIPVAIGPVNEDGTLTIIGVAVADIDTSALTTTVTVTNGVLNLGTTGGATVSGAGSGTLTLSGTAAEINAALATLSFVPTADYDGTAAFQISTTDGMLTDTDNRTITISPVADIANDSISTNEDVPVTIAPLANDSFENAGRTITAVTQGANGTVTINGDGTVTYTPNANFNGSDSFTYTVTSGGVAETATVLVTVNALNDAPVQTVPGAQTTSEDTPLVITGVAIADPDVGTLTTIVSLPSGAGTLLVAAGGTATISNNGTGTVTISGTVTQINAALASITYTPAADYNGSTTLKLSTFDGVVTAISTIAITVAPVADAIDDTAQTDEDTVKTFNVLTGLDTTSLTPDNFEGTPSVTAVTQPANGTVSFTAAGAITYTPNANFNGTDTFTYTVSSGGVTETATVTVTVDAVNDAPVNTVPGAQTAPEDTGLVFNATNGNAITITDADGNVSTTLTIANGTLTLGSISGVSVTGNGTGTVTLSGPPAAVTAALNGLTFAPTADWSGATTLNVSTTDGVIGAPVQSSIAITVTPVSDIVSDTVTVTEDVARTFNVLASDSFENAGAVVSSVTPPANGTVTIGAGGNVTYTPDPDYSGPDSFTYTVTSGGVTETTTVTLTVTPVNDPPVASPATSQTGVEGQAGSYDAGALFTDVDNASLSFAATGLPAGLSINPSTGLISGTIDSHASQGGTGGVYTVTVTATDASGALATTTFTWTVANPLPVAGNDAFTGTEDVAITGSVLGNDSDPDGDTLTVDTTPVAGPSNGSLVLNANGTFTYTPDPNFTGTDTFAYQLTDADGGTTTATVTLYVNPVNDSPLNTVPGNQTTAEDTPLVFTGANAITVSDADSASITTTLSVGHGTLTLGSLAGVTVSGDGTDTVTITGSPAAITAALNGLTYENTPDYSGPDTLNIVSSDGIATTTANLALSVSAVADITADTVSGSEDTAISFNVIGGTSGATADSFEGTPQVTGYTQPANGTVTIDAGGNVVYTPDPNFNGADIFQYTVTSGGVTETTTVTVNVGAANDAPTQTLPATQSTSEDTSVIFSGAQGNQIVIGDIDAGAVVTTAISVPAGALSAIPTVGVIITGNGSGTVTLVGTPAAITAALNGLTYTPVADYGGSVTLSVATDDGIAPAVAGTVDITIAPVADIVNDSTSTNEDVAKTITVLGNDSFENAGRAVTAVTQGSNGSVAINLDGTVTYTPNPDFHGSDSFTYTVTSGGVTETATVTVTVNPVNDAPTQVVPAAQTTTEDSGLTFSSATGNAITVADVDGGSITTTVSVTNGTIDLGLYAGVTVTGNGTGTVTITGDPTAINAALDGITFNPTADYGGNALMSVTTTDGAASTSNTIAITITPVVDIANDSATTNEDTAVTLNLLSNDSFESLTASITGATQPANGTVSIGSGGQVTYTPNPNYHGTDSFTYTVTSGGVTETETVTITVNSVNDIPATTVPAGQTTNEDAPLVFSAMNGNAITFADNDGEVLTVTLSGTNGTLTLGSTAGVIFAGDGTGTVTVTGLAADITTALDGLTFAPTADYSGTAGISVTTTDGTATTSTSIGINITPVVDIVADTIGTSEDTPVTFNALTNDSFEATNEAVTAVTQGASGTVSFLADGTIVYTPDANFHGSDTFTYTVTSGGVTETVTVAVTVGDVNDIPTTTGLADRYNNDGQSVSINAAAIFADADNDPLTYSATGLPSGLSIDTITGLITGTIDISASQGGPYIVTLTANDGRPGGTVSTTFTWNVANPLPTAVNDTSTTDEDTALTIDVLGNDIDPDGDPLTVTTATAGHGTVTINPDGSILYTPEANFNGTDTIVYEISDGNGGISTATVTVTITPVNDAPTAIIPMPDMTDSDSQSVSLDISYAFSDIDGDTLTYTITGLPAGLSYDPATGAISGSLDPSASVGGPSSNGIYPITIEADDGNGGTVTTIFTWTILNFPPTAGDDVVTTPEDTAVVATVLSNDFDPDGDPLSITHVNGLPISMGGTVATQHGSITLQTDSFNNPVLVYTPDPDFNGVESIVYTVDDGNGDVDTATLTVTVTPQNDAPTAGILPDLTNNDSETVSVDVSSFFADVDTPDGDTLAFSAIGLPPGLSIDPVTGVISGTLDASASQGGPCTAIVTATDEAGASVDQTFTWTVNNQPPAATNDSQTVAEGTNVSSDGANGVLSNDIDADADPLEVVAINGNPALVGTPIAGSSGGLFTVNADGSYSFDQDGAFEDLQSGEQRTATVTYRLSDGNGGFATAELSVTVTGVNDAPVATALAPITTVDSAPLTLNAGAAFTDVDGDTLSYSATGLPDGLAIDPVTGVISGTIDHAASQGGVGGAYTVTIIADDGEGGTTPVVLTITVTNPGPIAGDDTATTDEDTPVTGTVAGNDSDPDGDPLTFTKASDPANGTVAVNSVGTYTYTPDADFHGTDSFTYTVTDGNGGSETRTVTITVNPVNDTPVSTPLVTQNASDGASVTLNVAGNFSDVDGDVLEFSATGLPTGLSIDPATGIITGTVDHLASASGPYTVTVLAEDPSGEITEQTFTWNVTNPAPTGPAIPDATASDGSTVSIAAGTGFSDSDGDTFGFSATGLPAGLSIDPTTGTIAGTLGSGASAGGPLGDGVYTITVTATDSQGAAVSQTFAYTVTNPAPIAGADAFEGDEDMPIAGSVAGNDSDPDGDALTYALVTGPSHGSVTLNPDGTFTYTPGPDYNLTYGPETFTYSVTDANGAAVTATVTLTVNPVNDVPTATPIITSTAEDAPLNGTLAASDPDGDLLSYAMATPPTHGTLVVNPDGSYVYTPDPDYNGPDSFTFTASDGYGGTVTGTVYIEATSVNDPPVAANDPVPVTEDTPVSGNVLTNDTDTENDPLSVTGATVDIDGDGIDDPLPLGTPTLLEDSLGNPIGTLTLNSDGSFDFDPALNYTGPVPPVTFTVSDGTDSDTGTLTFGPVTAVNDPPVATSDPVPVTEDTPVSGNVLSNDGDTENDPLSVIGATVDIDGDGTPDTLPLGTPTLLEDSSGSPIGTLTLNSDGSFDFDPAPNYNGPVPAVTYTVSDGTLTDTGTLALGPVTAVNDAPVANTDPVPVTEDTPVSGNVLGNDTDVDGNPMTVTGATVDIDGDGIDDPLPLGTPTLLEDSLGNPIGTLTLNSDGSFDFDPAPNYNGPVPAVTYTMSDGTLSDTATLTLGPVTPANDAPVADDETGMLKEDTTLKVPASKGLLAGDTDRDGDPLGITTFEVAGLSAAFRAGDTAHIPGIGTLRINADGSYVFKPAPNYHGPVPLVSYVVSDGKGGIDTGLLKLTVTPVNDPPVAKDDTATTIQDQPVTVKVLGNDTDTDGDTLTVVSAKTSDGTVKIGPNGTLVFKPKPGFTGTATITYSISDGNGGFSIATIRVEVQEEAFVPVLDEPEPDDDADEVAVEGSTAVEPIVLDTLDEIEDLGNVSNTFGLNGIVVTAVNGLQDLNGLAASDHIGAVGMTRPLTTHEIERMFDDTRTIWSGRVDDLWAVKGLTGFALRYDLGTAEAGAQTEVVVEALVRDETLLIEVHAEGNEADIAEIRYSLANGEPLPAWLDRIGNEFLLGRRPADLEQLELRITVILTDGTFESHDVRIEAISGEVGLLGGASRQGAIPTFGEQFASVTRPDDQAIDELGHFLAAKRGR